MSKGEVVIVKKRKASRHGGHHGGAWKVAYADFVTAMMAFFLVLWIIGQSPAVKAAIAGYFRDPGLFQEMVAKGIIPGGTLGPTPDAPPMPESQAFDLIERKALEATGERIKSLLKEADLEPLENQIEITVSRDGLRIELLEAGDSTFFDTGSAVLAPATSRVLGIIAGELGKLANDVIVEGHTDSRPYTGEAYGNWELSTDRANVARRVMQSAGLRDGQVHGVQGYADTFLRNPADPLDASNRRVSIIVRHLSNPAVLSDIVGDHGAASGEGEAPALTPSP